MSGECDYANFLALNVVDDAVRESVQRQPTSVSPGCAQMRSRAQQCHRSFELCNEGQPDLGAGLAGVEESCFSQFAVGFGTDRRSHLIAARARAMASAAGTIWT